MIDPDAKPESELPPAPDPEPRPRSSVAGNIDELGALVQEVSDVARALARLALAETALSAFALRRVMLLRMLVIVAFGLALLFLGAAGVIALANWLGSTAAALAIVGVVFVALGFAAAERAKAWRRRIGYNETRAALRETLQTGGTNDGP